MELLKHKHEICSSSVLHTVNANELYYKSGQDVCTDVTVYWTGIVDWTCWTELVDWTGGLTLKLSNETHSPVRLHDAEYYTPKIAAIYIVFLDRLTLCQSSKEKPLHIARLPGQGRGGAKVN